VLEQTLEGERDLRIGLPSVCMMLSALAPWIDKLALSKGNPAVAERGGHH
jgi:hypothetical protein